MTLREAGPPSSSDSQGADLRILLVEDDPAMVEVVTGALRRRGYEVTTAATGGDALKRASETEPDLVLLDLGLPDLDGIEVCRRLRRWYTNPIVVLSADGDEDRKITALDDGANDYVTKPFAMGELLARLRAAGRHRQALAAAVDPTTFVLGDLRVDTGAHTATIGDTPLLANRKEFALLALLVRNAGRTLTHSLILEQVWGTTDLAKTETLRAHVNQLRRKLGDGPDRPHIATAPGVGYSLSVPD